MTSPSPVSTATNLSDSDATSIEINSSMATPTKKRPLIEETNEEHFKRMKREDEEFMKKKMANLEPPPMTPENTNTPALTATTYNNNTWVYHNLFTIADTMDVVYESDRYSEEFYNCTFIHDITQSPNGPIVVAKGEKVRMVAYDAESRTLHIFKGDGKVYVFHMATTLFGMKVEEDSESTDSDDEE